ncbi:molybdopterin-guanine dinucleotide biosynthesis protein B [Candidatus Lokiarchaeum ossiferum]|uniref:molybdopterin-guanine dinucleotide biosynthesis protein B n=1 Tax=Candidatus Lokiarchaeum ossiferum TaxID=2951803 RepID=UPI00352C8AAF
MDASQVTSIPKISFIGYSKSGKTASIEAIIKFLSVKKIRCMAFKHIHQDDFSIDTPGKNTWKYSQAGARIVCSKSKNESAFILNWDVSTNTLIKIVEAISESEVASNPKSIVLLFEGFRDLDEKKILCVQSSKEIPEQLDPQVVAVAGAVSSTPSEVESIETNYNLPVINFLTNPEKIMRIYDL